MSATLGKVGHDELFSFKKRPATDECTFEVFT